MCGPHRALSCQLDHRSTRDPSRKLELGTTRCLAHATKMKLFIEMEMIIGRKNW